MRGRDFDHARRAALSDAALADARGAGDPATLAAVLTGRHYTLFAPDAPDAGIVKASLAELSKEERAFKAKTERERDYLRTLDDCHGIMESARASRKAAKRCWIAPWSFTVPTSATPTRT